MGEDFYIIEILHQFLRVGGFLFKLLFEDLIETDDFDPSEKATFNPSKHNALNKLSNFLINEVKVQGFEAHVSTRADMLDILESMNGTKKRRFFEKLFEKKTSNPDEKFPFFKLFSEIRRQLNRNINLTDVTFEVFKAYWDIHIILRKTEAEKKEDTKKNGIIYNKEFIESKSKHLLESYLKLYSPKRITPYFHVTCFHLADQYSRNEGHLEYFCAEGLEKLNDLSTFQFFRRTNKKDFVKQMLEADQRIEMYREKNDIGQN